MGGSHAPTTTVYTRVQPDPRITRDHKLKVQNLTKMQGSRITRGGKLSRWLQWFRPSSYHCHRAQTTSKCKRSFLGKRETWEAAASRAARSEAVIKSLCSIMPITKLQQSAVTADFTCRCRLVATSNIRHSSQSSPIGDSQHFNDRIIKWIWVGFILRWRLSPPLR